MDIFIKSKVTKQLHLYSNFPPTSDNVYFPVSCSCRISTEIPIQKGILEVRRLIWQNKELSPSLFSLYKNEQGILFQWPYYASPTLAFKTPGEIQRLPKFLELTKTIKRKSDWDWTSSVASTCHKLISRMLCLATLSSGSMRQFNRTWSQSSSLEPGFKFASSNPKHNRNLVFRGETSVVASRNVGCFPRLVSLRASAICLRVC